jgi:hypothetical protein
VKILTDTPRLRLAHAEHHELAAHLAERDEVVNLLAVDTPYSGRTHSGHDGTLPGGRSPIPYAFWTPEDVHVFVQTWRPLLRGWLCSITDHVLWEAWQRAAEKAGLYAGFPPVPCVITGSRVRLRGDGPSSWSYFMLVARPPELVTWGTLQGAHVGPREPLEMTGAKPVWLMKEIVEAYSRPGDVVCDPVCGTGTTLVSSLLSGRSALGGDGALPPLASAEERLEAVVRHLGRPGTVVCWLCGGSGTVLGQDANGDTPDPKWHVRCDVCRGAGAVTDDSQVQGRRRRRG